MKKLTLLLFGLIVFSYGAKSQGCIAIRNLTGFGQFTIPQYDQEPIKWLVNVNTRYSEFHKTYVGSEEQDVLPEDRPFSNTFIVDFAVTRVYENGWSVTIDVPFIAASRETWQEHGAPNDKTKHATSSWGISDIRIAAYKWLYDVTKAHKGNIQVGLGIKLPTGDYRFQDYFYKPNGRVLAPVNSTLQLGDGGTGITTEVNAFYTLNSTVTLYGNIFYLFSPRDVNGTSTLVGNDPAPFQVESGQAVTSVPDAFTLRGGANFTMRDLVLWGGIRLEGSPIHDVIGSSNGQRRGGYSVSVEPGVNYKFKKSTIFAFVPVPIYRTLDQTVADQNYAQLSGTPFRSRGGMADYLIFIGVLFKI